MKRVLLFSGLVLLISLMDVSSLLHSAERDLPYVKSIRYGQHEGKTRFVVEASRSLHYKVFLLGSPLRVVVDLPVIHMSASKNFSPTSSLPFKALRFGRLNAQTSRLVLDAKAPLLLANVFTLEASEKYGWRLVVDLVVVNSRQFAAAPAEQKRRSSREDGKCAAQRERARKTVVIDPGHGGVDPGAISKRGVREKDITLSYGLFLRRALQERGGYVVFMTREKDTFLSLRERIRFSHERCADLFISMHANAFRTPNVRGASVYTLSEKPSDKEAERLAKIENASDVHAAVENVEDVQDYYARKILISIVQRGTKNASKLFANLLMEEVGKHTQLLQRPHRHAGFTVLKSAVVPSVVFEIGYMTNPKEHKALLNSAHRSKVIAATRRAIDRYFAQSDSLAGN